MKPEKAKFTDSSGLRQIKLSIRTKYFLFI